MMNIDLDPGTRDIGAIVTGVDLSVDPSEAQLEELRGALDERLVLWSAVSTSGLPRKSRSGDAWAPPEYIGSAKTWARSCPMSW